MRLAALDTTSSAARIRPCRLAIPSAEQFRLLARRSCWSPCFPRASQLRLHWDWRRGVERDEAHDVRAGLGDGLYPALGHSSLGDYFTGTKVGSGCHILAGATIGPRCTIGSNVIVNQGSIVCHDSLVDDHAHLTPGSILAGGVRVGSMTVVGMGATVLLGVKIGRNALIHNGSSITSDVADNTIVDARGKRQMRQAGSL